MKTFADEPQYKTITIEIEKEEKDSKYEDINIAPLSLTQASMYEEFSVIKINDRGNRQNRILGIDQNKLYNFEKEVGKNGKEGNEKIIDREFYRKIFRDKFW
jgi:hypothetical protein